MRPVGSKYFLEEPLGRGATGTVWRGRVRGADDSAGSGGTGDAAAGAAVAVKVLREELASDPDVVMRFLRERSVLVRLRHPHIVQVRDLVVEGDTLALVMDLVDGPDLHRYLRENGPFSPIGAALLTAAVADALAASHADGVVHRDLKPANVLLATTVDGDGAERMHPMLTDFGIARLADSPGVTRTHEFVGTPAYVAPESAQGRPQTSAVDVYGAGVLLYELVTGRPPFRGETAIEVVQAHLNEQPQRPPSVPEPLWTVMERCLRKDPAQRPSADNLARALRVVAAGVGAHASPAQAEAAIGVAALLGPDTSPAQVPGTFGGPGVSPSDPTQVLASGRAAYDPNAVTSVLPSDGGGGGPAGPGRPPADGGTRVMPPVPGDAPGGQSGQPQQPHPWESQLSAARHRNEQTEVEYLGPGALGEDPLARRPRRRPAQPPQQYGQQQGGGRTAQPYPPQGGGYGHPPRAPQGHDPRGYDQQRYAPQPQGYDPRGHQGYEPQRYDRPHAPAAPPPEAPRGREPRPPRERRRGANPMKIPGLGCLKGCLTVILVLVVIFVVVWYTTPLPDWVNSTRNLWDATSSWVHTVWHKASEITGGSGGGSGNG